MPLSVVRIRQEIAGILLKRGTLPLEQLQHISLLPRRTVQDALLVLSLHDCLHHARPLRSGARELYEINEVGLERRMRGARYAEMAFQQGGNAWSAIVEACWREGIASPAELSKELLRTVKTKDLKSNERKEEERRKEAEAKVEKKRLEAEKKKNPNLKPPKKRKADALEEEEDGRESLPLFPPGAYSVD